LEIGKDATSQAFSQADLKDYKVIHFAVHAIVDLDQPEDSALLIGSFPNMTFLGPRDILQFHLNSELVVLSACDTGVGRLQGQEGSWNLARSFLMAVPIQLFLHCGRLMIRIPPLSSRISTRTCRKEWTKRKHFKRPRPIY
jgi:hypothetical protein